MFYLIAVNHISIHGQSPSHGNYPNCSSSLGCVACEQFHRAQSIYIRLLPTTHRLWTGHATQRSIVPKERIYLLGEALAPVRRTDARPAIAHLLVMDLGVVDRHVQTEHLRRQPPDR